ncbi:ATP-binding protein [Peptoniphilus catoniae]|uniref:ATP-binding protein n=1 Tax=Peptoniphilus catoniae TaxID=1660341 RepID=UPI0010FDF09F|nr:ATP-binding protein [Peptoniphilus catoniae]
MDTIYKYKGTVRGDLGELRPFLDSAMINLKKYIYNEETIFDLKLILQELMVNGLIHGNLRDIHKQIKLTIYLRQSSITIKVEDEGEGVDFDFNSYDYKKRSSGGRGLILVKALTDTLVFNKNKVIVMKRI